MSLFKTSRIFSDNRILAAFILNFLEMGAYVSTVGYVNLGLMSQYDSSILPYFYFFQAVAAALIMAVSYNFIRKKPVLYINLYYITAGTIFIVSYILLKLGHSGVVFPTSVFLSVLTFQNAAIIGNTVSLAFDIREFIRISNWLFFADAVGGIFFGLTLPLIIGLFGGEFLLIINSLMLFGCLAVSLQLKPMYPPIERKMPTVNPLSNSFFRLVLYQKIILIVIFILMDFVFKIVLQQNFDKNMIGVVSTLFTGLTSFALILYAFYGQKFFIPRYGIVNTLALFPLFMVLAGPILIFFPVWIGVVITNGVIHVLFEGTYTAFQTFLNTLPRKMQMFGKTELSLLTLIIGEAGIAAVILYLLGEHASVSVIVLICIAFGILSLFLMRNMRVKYGDALGKQVEYQRILPFEDFYATKKSIKEKDLIKIIPLVGPEYSVYDVMDYFKNISIDQITHLIKDLETTKDIANFEARVTLLAKISSNKSDQTFIELVKSSSLIFPNSVAQSLAHRALNMKLSKNLQNEIVNKLKNESLYIQSLNSISKDDCSEFIFLEIKSRLNIAMERFFYYFAAVSNTKKVLNVLPNLLDQIFLKVDKVRRGDSIEFIETITEHSGLKRLLRDTLENPLSKTSKPEIQDILNQDSWFQYLLTIKQFIPGKNMDVNERILFLRKVKLFEPLSSEVLRIIAGFLKESTFKENEVIFRQGESADQVYFIVSGVVIFEKNGSFQKEGNQYEMFGEIGVLDNSTRRATVIAKTNVVLLSIEKQEFDQLLEDIPLLSKIIILQLISYLEKNTNELPKQN